MSSGSNAISWTLALLVIGGGVGAGVWYWKRPAKNDIEYRTAEVTRGDVIQTVTATGQLNPVVNVQVGSQISGNILKLYADFNSKVTNGQIVAQLDPATYRAVLMQGEADLANAQAALELAQVNNRRSESMIKDKLIPQADYDNAIAQLHQAEAQVKTREAQVERARVDLNRTTIYAPIDGIVISRNVDVGQTVAASLSAPVLFVIANDLAKMQIDAMVSEADVGGVELDQAVNFTVDAFPARTFHGKVAQVRNAAVVTQNVVTYDTVVEVHNRDLKLKPGMTANVSIITAQKEDVVKIPNAALRFRPPETTKSEGSSTNSTSSSASAGSTNRLRSAEGGGGEGRRGGPGGGGGGGRRQRPESQPVRTVYVLAEGTGPGKQQPATIKPVQVKIGISDGISTEVLEGLKEGDKVVTGTNQPQPPAGAQAGQSNPFGGGQRRGFR